MYQRPSFQLVRFDKENSKYLNNEEDLFSLIKEFDSKGVLICNPQNLITLYRNEELQGFDPFKKLNELLNISNYNKEDRLSNYSKIMDSSETSFKDDVFQKYPLIVKKTLNQGREFGKEFLVVLFEDVLKKSEENCSKSLMEMEMIIDFMKFYLNYTNLIVEQADSSFLDEIQTNYPLQLLLEINLKKQIREFPNNLIDSNSYSFR